MFKTLKALTIIVLLCWIAGCDTLNVGTRSWCELGVGNVTISSPTSMNAGEPAYLTVPWFRAWGPVTIMIEINGRTVVPIGTDSGISPFVFDFTLEEGLNTWAVTLMDDCGKSIEYGSYNVGESL